MSVANVTEAGGFSSSASFYIAFKIKNIRGQKIIVPYCFIEQNFEMNRNNSEY